MDTLLLLLCLGALWAVGAQWDAGIKHRRKARQEERDTHSLWWHVRAAADELKQAEKARKAAKRSAKGGQSATSLDQVQSENRSAAKAAVKAKREGQPKKRRAASSSSIPHSTISPVRRGARRVSFDYIDQQGSLTTREVTVERYSNGKIFAYCHLRRAERSFFVNSILGDVVDVKTGELLNKRAWVRTL